MDNSLRQESDMSKIAWLFLVMSVIFVSLSLAQDLSLVRLTDIVGDTIDLAERDQYNLFPGINNFESAWFFITKDSNNIAEITYCNKDSINQIYLKLTPYDVSKIGYLINKADTIKKIITSDENQKLVLDRF